MAQSKKAARIERHKRRRNRGSALNLTALMDIFTILVFFLLVNSSQEQPPSHDNLVLPISTATKELKDNLIIMVTSESILVQGVEVANAQIAKNLEDDSIPGLSEELRRQAQRIRANTDDPVKASEITIMADKEIPYKLLRKLMFTCTERDFTRISLLVIKQEKRANENG